MTARIARRTAASSIASALEPFVRDGTFGGAVTLVADRDGVLGIDKVGFADVQKRSPMRDGRWRRTGSGMTAPMPRT
jgi:hypothetical protein